MKLLNLCCGATRPQSEEWTNLDDLHQTLLPGTPERSNLDAEKNYVNCDVLKDQLPFGSNTFDGILASHCIEHWTCQEAVKVMRECHHVLKPGGVLLVSVPDASYFRRVYEHDTVENAVGLFGEPIHLPDGERTFFGYGLFNRWHKTILTEDVLWCYFRRAGFNKTTMLGFDESQMVSPSVVSGGPLDHLADQLNRLKFSLCMAGIKG